MIERRVAEVADADAGHAQPMLVRVHGAKRLAERLADTVTRVWPHRLAHADLSTTRIVPDRVVRGCEHDALDPRPARRLEQVVTANDVGLQDRLPRPLYRETAE